MSRDPSFIDGGIGRAPGGGSAMADSGLGTARRDAGPEDERKFGDLMRRRDGAAEEGAAATDTRPSPFDLFRPAGAGAQTPPTTMGAGAPATAAGDLRGIVEAMAERLLVSDGDGRGHEVRVQLKDSVLPGTEIRFRQEGGRAVVEFVCANADSLRFLDGQRGGLAVLLEGRLNGEVDLRVTASDGTLGDGEPQDGRSRQRYLPPDEAQP